MHNEEWRSIAGYEGIYEVSSLGRVRSLDRVSLGRRLRGRIMKTVINAAGREMIGLNRPGEKYVFRAVHRLVAIAFVDGSDETVNHKDGDKRNNRADNLEWMSVADNIRHAMDMGLRENCGAKGQGRAIIGVGPNGQGLYLKQVSVAPRYGFDRSLVGRVAKGIWHSHRGWTFQYA